MSIFIQGIGTAAGNDVIDNVGRAGALGKEPSFIAEKIGFTQLRRLKEGETLVDLCLAAFKDLSAKATFAPEEVECLVVVTQNPADHGLPHTSAILHGLLGLPAHVAAFDVSLGCSGYVYALELLKGLMTSAGLNKALLFTADPYSRILDHNDVNTELLFSDAATCTLLGRGDGYSIGATLMCTNGAKYQALQILPQEKYLYMDGRGIFNFTMTTVPAQIKDALQKNGLSMGAVDFFVLHQASFFIVQQMGRVLGLPAEKAPFNLPDIGNCVSSTIPFSLSRLLPDKPGTLLLSGFGVGLSWATTIITRK